MWQAKSDKKLSSGWLKQGKWVMYVPQTGVRFPGLKERRGEEEEFYASQPIFLAQESKTGGSLVRPQIMWLNICFSSLFPP